MPTNSSARRRSVSSPSSSSSSKPAAEKIAASERRMNKLLADIQSANKRSPNGSRKLSVTDKDCAGMEDDIFKPDQPIPKTHSIYIDKKCYNVVELLRWVSTNPARATVPHSRRLLTQAEVNRMIEKVRTTWLLNINENNTLTDHVTSLSWSPNGKLVAIVTQNGRLFVLNTSTTQLNFIDTFKLSRTLWLPSKPLVKWNHSGTMLAVADDHQHYTSIYDPRKKYKHTVVSNDSNSDDNNHVTDFAWSNDNRLAIASRDYVIVYSTGVDKKYKKWKRLHGADVKNIVSLSYNSNGYIASLGLDGTLCIWQPKVKQPLVHTYTPADIGTFASDNVTLDIAFEARWNPVFPLIMVVRTTGKTVVCKFDEEYERVVAKFSLPLATPGKLAWSPDGNLLAVHNAKGKEFQIYELDLDDDGISMSLTTTSVTHPLLQYTAFDWNPNSSQLVFTDQNEDIVTQLL